MILLIWEVSNMHGFNILPDYFDNGRDEVKKNIFGGYFFIIGQDGKQMKFIKRVLDADTKIEIPSGCDAWHQYYIKPDLKENKCHVDLDGQVGSINLKFAFGCHHDNFILKSFNRNIPVKDAVVIEVRSNPIAGSSENKLSATVFGITDDSGRIAYYNESLGKMQSPSNYFVFSPYCPEIYKLDIGKLYETGLVLKLPFKSGASENQNPLVKVSFKILDAQSGELIKKARLKYEKGTRYHPGQVFNYAGKKVLTINYKDTVIISADRYKTIRCSKFKNGLSIYRLEPLYEEYKVKVISKTGIPWSNREIKVAMNLIGNKVVSTGFSKTDSNGEAVFKIKKIDMEKNATELTLVPKDKYFTLMPVKSAKNDAPTYVALPSKRNIQISGKIVSSKNKVIPGVEVKVFVEDTFMKGTKTDSQGNYSIPVSDYKAGQKLTVKAGHPDYLSGTSKTIFDYNNDPITFTLLSPKATVCVLVNRSRRMKRFNFFPLKRSVAELVKREFHPWPISALGSFKEEKIDLIVPFGHHSDIYKDKNLDKLMGATATGGCNLTSIFSQIPELIRKNNAGGSGNNKTRVVVFTCSDLLLEDLPASSPKVRKLVRNFKDNGLELHLCLIAGNTEPSLPLFKALVEETGGKLHRIKDTRSKTDFENEIMKLKCMEFNDNR